MTTETLMTTEAATTTEGQAASEQATAPATVAEPGSQQQQATEGQTEEGRVAESGETEGEQAKQEGAPEKYEFKPLEGNTFDDAVLGAYSEVAKELGLPQEKAQMVLDKVAPVIAARQAEMIETVRMQWGEDAKTDKEFGGAKLTENMAVAKKALDTFGTPELRALLNESGLGNHPEIIRVLYRAGKAISQDNFVGGRTAPPKGADTASVLYPNQK